MIDKSLLHTMGELMASHYQEKWHHTIVVKIWPASGSRHVFRDRNMNRLTGTHSVVSTTSYPKTSFIHIFKAIIPPPGVTPTPI